MATLNKSYFFNQNATEYICLPSPAVFDICSKSLLLFHDTAIMDRSTDSPPLNSIDNLRSVLILKAYKDAFLKTEVKSLPVRKKTRDSVNVSASILARQVYK
ncbi:unnamed protein product [Calicophoron daubneyi]|uniref:Uncharacterized protein n=1 Tax=Calicophoron daubneyi TaxID=300641 RepID=A0AAV2TA90_CALDB